MSGEVWLIFLSFFNPFCSVHGLMKIYFGIFAYVTQLTKLEKVHWARCLKDKETRKICKFFPILLKIAFYPFVPNKTMLRISEPTLVSFVYFLLQLPPSVVVFQNLACLFLANIIHSLVLDVQFQYTGIFISCLNVLFYILSHIHETTQNIQADLI